MYCMYCMYCMYLNPTHRVANKLVSLSLKLKDREECQQDSGKSNDVEEWAIPSLSET